MVSPSTADAEGTASRPDTMDLTKPLLPALQCNDAAKVLLSLGGGGGCWWLTVVGWRIRVVKDGRSNG